jgi:DNA-binding transcriptional MerR regulator
MSSSAHFLNSSEAANRLGVSVKALRIYEQRGLITPIRTNAGWRAYGPGEIPRAAEIVSLGALGSASPKSRASCKEIRAAWSRPSPHTKRCSMINCANLAERSKRCAACVMPLPEGKRRRLSS